MFEKLRIYLKRFKSSPNYYQVLGRKKGISELVDNFYLEMETNPKASDCLKVHSLIDGKVSESSKEKLKDFLSGWLGGPNLFVEKYGHPRMRMRHMHIKITELERDQWLFCMNMALKNHPKKLKTKHKIALANSFAALAYRIKNS